VLQKIKAMARWILPDGLIHVMRGISKELSRLRPSATWDGIYPHLLDVPVPKQTSYNDDRRVLEMLEDAERVRSSRDGGSDHSFLHEALVMLAACCSANGERIRVVDFGGGLATGFLQLISFFSDSSHLSYEVVELEKMVKAGGLFHAKDPRIRFVDSLEQIDACPDILYVNSVIQYIPNYQMQLEKFAALGAKWVLFVRAAIADLPTYATKQVNLAGQELPYWFLNCTEVTRILQNKGYDLVLNYPSGKPYGQLNFPAEYRIGKMRNLLFVRGS